MKRALAKVAKADDVEAAQLELTDTWERDGLGIETVEPVLQLMEANPRVEWGAPGALTHWIEKFNGKPYEALVLASLKRRPTWHTVWLLHRLLNATKGKKHRAALVDALLEAREHPKADAATREHVEGFLALPPA